MVFSSLVLGVASVTSCAALTAGDHVISVRATNDTVIHVPAHYAASKPTPLLLALHGLGENYPQNFQREIAMDELADQETFVVAYPLGSKSVSTTLFGHTWNGGKCCFSSADDFDYLKQVVEKAAELVTVDRSRVYSLGFSAGGVMSHTLACQAADIFAAVVSVDGPIEIKGDCSPSRSVPVMHFHGSLDLVFPYSGSPLYHGALQTLKIWHDADQCSGESSTSELTSRIKVETYSDCGGAEVQLATVHNGGHAWPPKSSNPEQLIWNFLSQWTISKDETVAV